MVSMPQGSPWELQGFLHFRSEKWPDANWPGIWVQLANPNIRIHRLLEATAATLRALLMAGGLPPLGFVDS